MTERIFLDGWRRPGDSVRSPRFFVDAEDLKVQHVLSHYLGFGVTWRPPGAYIARRSGDRVRQFYISHNMLVGIAVRPDGKLNPSDWYACDRLAVIHQSERRRVYL